MQRRRPRKGRQSEEKNESIAQAATSSFPVMRPSNKVNGGFPSRMRVRLKYSQTVLLSPAAGSADSLAWGLRNMYDPYTPAGGHQPSNFDRWTAIYNRWTVISTDVKVTSVINSSSSVQPTVWGFLISKTGGNVAGFSSLDNLLEQPYVKYSNTVSGLANAVGAPNQICTARVPSLPWLGMNSQAVLFSDEFSGTSGAGPSEDVAIEVFAWTTGSAPASPTMYRIELVYDAVFFQPLITLPS